MALHNLKITVIDGGSVRGTGDSIRPKAQREKKDDPRDSKLYKALHLNSAIKDKIQKEFQLSPMAMMGIMGGVGIAKQIGRQWMQFYLSDIGRRHGDSNYQAMIGRRMEVAGDVLSVGGGMLSGAAAGSIFGIKGAIIGAAIGGISAGVSIGFRQMDRQRSYAHQMFQENTSQAYGLARANFSALTGRLR